jgi:DNA-binding NarL/FixJ family response regulator
MEPRIRIIVVEDVPEFLANISAIIRSEPDFELCGTASSGVEALGLLASRAVDVLIVDLGLPDMDGIDIIRKTLADQPGTDIIVLTIFGDEPHVVASIEAGASGYLLKDTPAQAIIRGIKEIRAGGSPISPIIARKLLQVLRAAQTPQTAEANPLSSRETEILTLISKGMTFEEIGKLLAISPHTVGGHVKNIYGKLAVHSRNEAVYEAYRLGIILP